MTNKFLQVSKALLSAKQFKSNKTGEIVDLSLTARIYLAALIDRSNYFKNEGKEHYDTHQYFADAIGVSEAGIRNVFKLLCEHGVIEISTIKHKCSHNKIVYERIVMPELIDRTDPTPSKPATTTAVAKPALAEHGKPATAIPDWINDVPMFDYSEYDTASAASPMPARVPVSNDEDPPIPF